MGLPWSYLASLRLKEEPRRSPTWAFSSEAFDPSGSVAVPPASGPSGSDLGDPGFRDFPFSNLQQESVGSP